MMKPFFLSLLLLVAGRVSADTVMLLHPKGGGEPTQVRLADQPVATYEDDELVIQTDSTILRFSLSEIDYVCYDERDVNGIESIASPSAGVTRVYDLQGQLLKTIPAGEPLTLTSLPTGVYIIKNNQTTYKIQKR